MISFSLPANRRRFVGPRLALSVVVLALFCGVIGLAWYPGLHWQLAGVSKQLLILVAAVLVIGAGLSTLVYRPGKPGMTLDLVIILLVELAAIAYVGSLLYERRPQYLVFVIDRLQVVAADQVTDHPYRFPELQRSQPVGPVLANARFPDDPAERAALKKSIFFDGHPDIDVRPDHWYPWASAASSVLAAAGSLADFRRRSEHHQAVVDAWLGTQKAAIDDYLVLPVVGNNSDATALVDPVTGYPVAMLDIDPWQ